MISESSKKGIIRAYQLMMSHISTFLNYLYTAMNVHQYRVVIDRQFRLRGTPLAIAEQHKLDVR